MTNHYTDMQNTDVFIVCGSNNAENHPASMRHVNRAREKGAKLVVIDPRFTRTAATADHYYQMRSGTDIALFGGIINYLLQNDLYNRSYVEEYTNASYLVNPEYDFSDGMFSGFSGEEGPAAYDRASWSYQIEGTTEWDTSEDGQYAWVAGEGVPEFTTPAVPEVKKDPSMQDPNCVMQLMKKHYERYTPETVSRTVGMSESDFLEICEIYASTAADDRSLNWLYAMGITQHSKGSQNVRAKSMIQLLLGNMGIAGGGIAALRGKCNIQGSTDFGLLHNILPGYNPVPSEGGTPTLRAYNEGTAHSGFWANRPRFIVSKLKEFWGDHATIDNDYCFDYLPKLGSKTNYSFMEIFEEAHAGKIKGLFSWGMNPVVGGPNSNRTRGGLAKLDWLVSVDVFENDTSNFWSVPLEEGGEATPESIDTEVFLLPAASHIESEGTITNSGRWAQWRYAALNPIGEALRDGEIMTRLFRAYQEVYAEGGVFPDPIMNLTWDYVDENGNFDSRRVAQAINGYTVEDRQLLSGFGQLQANGTTACMNWIYSGYYSNNEDPLNPAVQPCGARDASDRTVSGLGGGLKQFPQWAFAWPLNRRIVYNRASTHKDTGLARNPERILVQWNGNNWDRNDVPDFAFQRPVGTDPVIGEPTFEGIHPENCPAFFMNAEYVARLFAPGMVDGPFAEHYEPYESPINNPLSGRQNIPTALVFEEASRLGTASEFPIVATTWRVVEHWQSGTITRNLPYLGEAMPHMFVEISEELAEEKGISTGDRVEVFNNRGVVEVYAMVTKRMKTLKVDGKNVHQLGMPWHWGQVGMARGASANTLTPSVGDGNTFIPEYKAFLVDIRKVG